MRKNVPSLNYRILYLWGFLILCFFLFLAPSCDLFKESSPLECSLLELRSNPSSGYYDAVVSVTRLQMDDPLKSRFSLTTPTQYFEMTDIQFQEDNVDTERMEIGDVFIVPLQKPDWKFYIREENEFYCSHNIWDQLPVDDQWHPTKSEAMTVADTITVQMEDGLPIPMVGFIPDEWALVDEGLPDQDDPRGYLVYQKIRADEVKEEMAVNYSFLSERELDQLSTSGETTFLTDWTEWTRKESVPAVVAGHTAVAMDMPGIGSYGWSYRYAYIDSEMVIEVNIEADPLEWVKTDQEKILEGKTRTVLLRYGYGPIGEPGWQIMIEIRMTGEGMFYKRSRRGISIDKAFQLENWEFNDIQKSISDNRFIELESRSGPPGGQDTFLSILHGEDYHTVELKNIKLDSFESIARRIKEIVLPKVDEK
ncbi:hypothetical protein ACFLT9_00900 [Acidobacteriota bacterium]